MDVALSRPALSTLIGEIYDCALDPGLWRNTLQDIARALDASHMILSLNELATNRILISTHVGWSNEWLAVRQQHAGEIHDRLSEWFSQRLDENEPYIGSRVLPSDYLVRSSYVRECLQPLGIAD